MQIGLGLHRYSRWRVYPGHGGPGVGKPETAYDWLITPSRQVSAYRSPARTPVCQLQFDGLGLGQVLIGAGVVGAVVDLVTRSCRSNPFTQPLPRATSAPTWPIYGLTVRRTPEPRGPARCIGSDCTLSAILVPLDWSPLGPQVFGSVATGLNRAPVLFMFVRPPVLRRAFAPPTTEAVSAARR